MFLLSIALIWCLAAVTPGPNFFVVTRCALAGSRRAGLAAVLGTVCGTLVWGLAGWLGINALFAAAPVAYLTLKVVGGMYLTWLGFRLLVSALSRREVEMPAPPRSALTPAAAWRLGLVTNLANPKSVIFVASLFAATLPPDAPAHLGAAAVALMVTISGLWYLLIAFVFSRPQIVRGYRRIGRWIDAAVGIVFVLFGARLTLSSR